VPPAPSLEELAQKRTLISAWLAEKSADRVIVEKLNNQAWLTGGLDFHEISNTSVVKIEVPKNPEEPIAIYLNNIERPRIVHHELAKLGEDWITAIKLVINNWAVEPALPRGRKVVTDTGTDFDRLHYSFLPADLDRYRWLGQMAAAALTKAAWLTVPDRDSEKDVETRIFSMLNPHEIFPEVLLVASDYYHFLTNHPIARLGAIIKRDLIMVLCARWHGYIVNLSRQVHFGRITSDSELAIIFAQCSRIFAQAVNQTRPGILFRNIFQNMQARATRLGYPTATEDVHFGGPTGIGIRDFCATAESPEEVLAFQPFTWNPILRGASSKVKCEDTYCTGAKANSRPERITIDPYGYWPLRNVGGGGRSKMSYAVPRIFEYLQK
jgi:Xaa-Pro aminopeptidase